MYFGDKEIKAVADSESGMAGILFTDDTSLTIPKWELEAGQTEEPKDLMWVKNARCNGITEKILETMLEMKVRLEDANLIGMKITESLKMNYQKACDKKFGKVKNELNLADIDFVLKNQ
jgi:hypothetical protein